MKILSLDFGTSSLKLAVVDDRLNILRSTSHAYDYHVYDADKVEMEPARLLEALKKGAADFSDIIREIELVAFCAFSPSGVYLDGSGEMQYPVITHLDRRAKAESRWIVENFGAGRFQRITGILPFVGGASVTTLKWMMNNRPDVMRNVKTYAHLPTWLYALMTGVVATDPVNASMTGMYRTVASNGWSEEILSALEINKNLLPPIQPAGSILGTLNPQIASMCGLKAGIPVALGTNDIASALVGAECVRTGMALNVCGSSEMISVLTHEPVTNPCYYLRKSAIEGLWQCYSTMVGGFGLEWFRKQLCREMTADEFYNEYLKTCIRSGVASTVSCDPYFAGDRQSLEVRRGTFRGLTLESTREEMLCSLLESMNEHMAATLAAVPDSVNVSDEIAITGGMATPEVIEMKERLFKGKRFVYKDNCTILGNVKLAMMAGNQSVCLL